MSNFGTLIKKKRMIKMLSQEHVAKILGYKNGQFISNVERGLCSFPDKKAKKLMLLLNITESEYIRSKVEDFRNNLLNHLSPF